MHLYPVAPLRLLPPATVIGLALWLRPYLDQLGSEVRILVTYLPYLLCLIGLLLAFQLNRSRLLLATLALGYFYWLVQTHLQVSLSRPEASRTYLAASLAAPLLCLYLLLLPETGLRNLRGLIAALGFLLLALACSQLALWLPGVSESAAEYYRARPVPGYVLSFGASVLIGLVMLVGLILVLYRSDDSDAALLGVLAAVSLALALLHLADISVAMCVAAGLCLVWGLLRSTHAMAYRDELTGLLGRRALNERLAMPRRNYCIAMVDVDHFKRFNDKHGHDVGDEVLRMVAAQIARVGAGGKAFRYGGEEFCVLFPRKSLEQGAAAMEAVREAIAAYHMSLRNRALRPDRSRDGARRRGATRVGGSRVSITISAGLAARDDATSTAESVLKAADKMLYRAKAAGRNRVAY